MTTRREVLAGAGCVILAPSDAGREAVAARLLSADLDRYVGYGVKASGGPGDTACGAWLDATLRDAGYVTARQEFPVPHFDARKSRLRAGDRELAVIPQAIVVPTGADGIAGPLVTVAADCTNGPLPADAIALVDLPYRRWSSIHDGNILATVRQPFASGARAAQLVTNGPPGEAIALNGDGDRPLFDRPLAVLAPRAFAQLRATGARRATLTIDGTAGTRAAFNLAGRIDRGVGRWLVVSTPRSGWTIAAGERGPGIAAWLALSRWAPAALPGLDLAFLCNSGHEYENLGASRALRSLAPRPGQTAFWLHLGASLATRDWHDLGGGRLLPLPSADPQRFLMASPPWVTAARNAIAGIAGLEMAYPAGPGAPGELAGILAARYQGVAGIFGAHRYHHTVEDDARCVDASLVTPVVEACKRLISRVLC